MSAQHEHPHDHPHKAGRNHHHQHRHPHLPTPKELKASGLGHHHFSKGPAPTGTARVKKVWRWVYGWCPKGTTLGVWNCRKIAGSTKWSEHAWGDALDFTHPGYPESLMPVKRALMARKGRFDITRVIGPDNNSAHHNHLHIDVDPDHFGTPPCA